MSEHEDRISLLLRGEARTAVLSDAAYGRVLKRSRIRRATNAGIIILGVAIVAGLGVWIGDMSSSHRPIEPIEPAAATPAHVFFPTVGRSEAVSGAKIAGMLLERGNCVFVVNRRTAWLVLWPEGYSITASGDRIEVRDDSGNVIGLTGEEVTLAGGEINSSEVGGTKRANTIVQSLIKEEVPARCRSDVYWLATPS